MKERNYEKSNVFLRDGFFGVIFLVFLQIDSVIILFLIFKIFTLKKSVKLATLPTNFRLTFPHTLNCLHPILNLFHPLSKTAGGVLPNVYIFHISTDVTRLNCVFLFFPHFATNKHPFRVFIDPGNVILVCPPVTAQNKKNQNITPHLTAISPRIDSSRSSAATASREIG